MKQQELFQGGVGEYIGVKQQQVGSLLKEGGGFQKTASGIEQGLTFIGDQDLHVAGGSLLKIVAQLLRMVMNVNNAARGTQSFGLGQGKVQHRVFANGHQGFGGVQGQWL